MKRVRISNRPIFRMQSDFLEIIRHIQNLSVFLLPTHPLAKVVERKVRAILQSKKSQYSLDELLLFYSQPRKMNGPIREQRDLQKILNARLNAHSLRQALSFHAEKYSYLGYREPFCGGYPRQFFIKRFHGLFSKHTQAIQGQKKPDIRFSTDEKKWIHLMQEFVFFRNYRTERFYEAIYYFEPMISALSAYYKLGKNALGYYTLEEVQNLFQYNMKVPKRAIEQRMKGFGVVLLANKKTVISGKELRQCVAKYRARDVLGSKELRGMIACQGKATGRVKIVLASHDQYKVKKGDILITSMTTPDFLPAMEKAAAFVTDEGGITCHAAIVAREMNKPCIIGTKNATRIFKDGDLVCVDAITGVIQFVRNKPNKGK